MNKLYLLSLLVLSLVVSPDFLDAQRAYDSKGGGTLSTTGQDTGTSPSTYPTIQLGEHMPQEMIITFGEQTGGRSSGMAPQQIINTYLNQGASGFEYSPSGKYALIEWKAGLPRGRNLCDIIGNGTTGSLSSAQGTQIDLNYIVGVTPIGMPEILECLALEDFNIYEDANDIGGTTGAIRDLGEYSPLNECPTPHSNIVPSGGNSIVKVAIVDAGFRDNIFTRSGGLPVERASFGVNSGVNPHAEIIARLIAGQAHAAGVADKVQLFSYPVLDFSLRGSIWTVIKALDQAIIDEVNIVNLSLSFPGPITCQTEGVMLDIYDQTFEEDDVTRDNEPTATAEQITSLLKGPLKRLEEANILVINAAGNDGLQLGGNNHAFPAMEEGLYNLVTVGALSCQPNLPAGWSNQGSKYIELYAPGTAISPFFECEYEVSGTSFAAPLVTAAAAIHATTLSAFSIYDVNCYLESAATPFDEASWGILNHTDNVACQKSAPVSGSGKSFTANSEARQLTASPNPFSGELKLQLPAGLNGEATTVRLLNANGKVMLERSTTNGKMTLNTSTLPRGVYWVNIRNAKTNETTTVVRR